MSLPEEIRRAITAVVAEAQAVGDSPSRADRVAERVAQLVSRVKTAELADEMRSRVLASLADAERVLRRDDDGREAARHLQTALRWGAESTRSPSPFS